MDKAIFNKRQLIEAQQKYNQDFLDHPFDYESRDELMGTKEYAEDQINHLLKFINK